MEFEIFSYLEMIFCWLIIRLQYLWCVNNGDTSVLDQAINITFHVKHHIKFRRWKLCIYSYLINFKNIFMIFHGSIWYCRKPNVSPTLTNLGSRLWRELMRPPMWFSAVLEMTRWCNCCPICWSNWNYVRSHSLGKRQHSNRFTATILWTLNYSETCL